MYNFNTSLSPETHGVDFIRGYFLKHFILLEKILKQNKELKVDDVQTISFIGAFFVANEPYIFGKPNEEYIKQEIDWYNSQSLNIFDLKENPPKLWKKTANENGEINSNYGHIIFSDELYNQYNNVLEELVKDQNSRRAVMIYNRPSIWDEYNKDGKNDFICTNSASYNLNNIQGKDYSLLDVVVQMRSNDIWAGYRNDYAWQKYIQEKLVKDINEKFKSMDNMREVKAGDIIWQVQNLHAYRKDYWLIDAYIKGEKDITKKEYKEKYPESIWL